MSGSETKPMDHPTLEELCAAHRNEESHAQHVAALALRIFDAVSEPLQLSASDRPLLERAARLHDIGFADKPADHVAEGIAIVRRSGLKGVRARAIDEITAIMALHGRLPDAVLTGTRWERVPRPSRILRLGAILRVADALDHGHLQDSRITDLRIADGMVRLYFTMPTGSRNAERAMAKSDLWQRVCPLGLVLVPRRHRRPGRIRAADPAGAVLRTLLLTHYRVLRISARRAARDQDEEALHDLRIAVRSLRRLLEAFERILRGTSARRVSKALRAFAKRLGPARDFDVWMGILQRPRFARSLQEHPAFLDRQSRGQAATQAALRVMLADETTQTLMEQLGFLLRIELQGCQAPGSQKPFSAIARRALHAAWETFWNRRHLAKSNEPLKLHALRVRLRKLRLLAMLVRPDAPPVAADFIETLHDLERNLGRIHDLDEASRHAGKTDAPISLHHLIAKRRRKEWRSFRKAWRCFAASDPAAESALLWTPSSTRRS